MGGVKNADSRKEDKPKHPVLVKFEEIVGKPQSEWYKLINTFNTEYKWECEKLHLKEWTNVFEKLKQPFIDINEIRKQQNESKKSNNETNSNNSNSSQQSTLILPQTENDNLQLIITLLNCFVKLLSHSHRPITAFNVLDVCILSICICCM